MLTRALAVVLEAKAGKEAELEAFLKSAVPLVNDEPGTAVWFALRFSGSKFGIFDAFADEGGRAAHLAGKVAAALMAKAPDLLAKAPMIEKVDILAEKAAK